MKNGLIGVALTLMLAWSGALHGSEIFYLDVQKGGCYTFTGLANNLQVPIALSSDEYKRLAQVDCNNPHHIKVIDVSRVPYVDFRVVGLNEDVTNRLEEQADVAYVALNTNVVQEHCVAAFRSVMGREPAAEIKPGNTYLRWFYPDSGMERHRYHGTMVCYVHQADERYENYVLMQEQ